MIARIEFEYGESRTKLLALARGEKGVVERILMKEVKADQDEWQFCGDYLLDLQTDGAWLSQHGVSFIVKNLKGTIQLAALAPEAKEPTNVYVQVPHIGLLTINEVKVEEDYCTDRLQGDLDAGWRILCVCPPNAMRRPTYILGRSQGY